MDFSFCNSFSIFLPCSRRFGLGALGDSRNPAMSAQSLLFVLVVSSVLLALPLLRILRPVRCSVSLCISAPSLVPYSDRLMVLAPTN